MSRIKCVINNFEWRVLATCLPVNCCCVHRGFYVHSFSFLILFPLFMTIFPYLFIYLFSCNLVGAISHTLRILWWHPHLSYLLCKKSFLSLFITLCIMWEIKTNKLNWIELNWIIKNKRKQKQTNKILESKAYNIHMAWGKSKYKQPWKKTKT